MTTKSDEEILRTAMRHYFDTQHAESLVRILQDARRYRALREGPPLPPDESIIDYEQYADALIAAQEAQRGKG